jgi:hypothetical protein
MKVAIAAALLVLLGVLFFVTQVSTENGGDPVSAESILKLLDTIPDTPENRFSVVINNYIQAEISLGIKRPNQDASFESAIDYAFELSTKGNLENGPFIAGYDESSRTSLAVLKANAGYDLRDVQLSISAGLPPAEFEAVLLNLGADKVLEQILSSQAWDSPAQMKHNGETALHWSDVNNDGQFTINPPAINQFGQGADLGFFASTLVYATEPSAVHNMIDAHLGNMNSLGDLLYFQELVQGVSKLGLYSMVLSDGTQSIDSLVEIYSRIHPAEDEIAAYRKLLESEIRLQPYQAFSTGIGKDSAGFYMGLALSHENEESAKANEILLRTRLQGDDITSWTKDWSVQFDLSTAEFTSSGTLLTAKVPFAQNVPSNQWVEWLYLRDALLLHE